MRRTLPLRAPNHQAVHVSQHIIDELACLWRHGVVWSGHRDIAEDLVQATYLRTLDRVEEFQLGTHIDHQLLAILNSISIIERAGTPLGGQPESALLAIANTHREVRGPLLGGNRTERRET
jgi:hypothetical protein